jgi:uncharacterized protein with PIN domain
MKRKSLERALAMLGERPMRCPHCECEVLERGKIIDDKKILEYLHYRCTGCGAVSWENRIGQLEFCGAQKEHWELSAP